jgi:signal transduction histidine kinase/DNA-binding response OmpR family regulator
MFYKSSIFIEILRLEILVVKESIGFFLMNNSVHGNRLLFSWTIAIISSLFIFNVSAQKPDSLLKIYKKNSISEKSSTSILISQFYLTIHSDSSFFYAQKALSIAEQSKNDTLKAKAHRWMGEWYQNKSKYSESAEEYWKSIRLSQKIQNKSIESAAFNGLAITYYLQNDLEKAEEYIERAAQLRYEIKDFTYYSVLLSNLAVIYFQNKEFDKAIALLRNVEKSLLKQPEGAYMASLYNTLGGCYQMAYPEKDSAIYYYKKSIELAKRFDVPQNLMTGYHNLGEDALRKRNFEEALEFLNKALDISKTLGNDSYVMNIHNTLSETFALMGDYKNALQHKTDEFVLSKKIFEAEKQKTIKEMEFKYETAVKDQKLLEQEEIIQKSLLETEIGKNKRNRLIFSFLLILLLAGFYIFFQYQKRTAQQKLEAEKAKIFENIVHDIRTPLTLIKGPMELIKKEYFDSQTSEAFKTIEVQSEKLISLVNELLDASKLEKRKYIPHWTIGNPWLEVTKQIEGIREVTSRKKIAIEVGIDEKDIQINFPSDVFEKVLANLLSNAVKFTPENGTIKVGIHLAEQMLKLEVYNSGSEISIQNKDRIFERFYRQKQHQSISGTGIGLSVAKELLDLVHGTISVDNLNHGVEFSATFPVESLNKVELNNQNSDKPLLLIVEDNLEIRSFISNYLFDEFQIIHAENGEVGLELAIEKIPDLILTDVIMPELNGLELLNQLKTNEVTSHIPVVICSSKNAEQSRLEGLESGAAAYVPKPFNPEELKLTLKNIWRQESILRKKYQDQTQKNLPSRERLLVSHDFVNKATDVVFQEMENTSFDVNLLSERLFLSRSQLHRKLTQLTGLSASQFINKVRLEQAKDYLHSGKFNVTETAFRCGFNSQSYFTKSFQEYTGETPTAFILKRQKS